MADKPAETADFFQESSEGSPFPLNSSNLTGTQKNQVAEVPSAKQRNRERYQKILKQQELREKRETGKALKFRDRAAERRLREQTGELESAELQAAKKLTEEESKYLGGDIQHTHLVKGLDYILLDKIRSELESKKLEAHKVENTKLDQRPKAVAPEIRNLTKQLIAVLKSKIHPHSVNFQTMLSDMDLVILKGHQLKSFHLNPLNNIKLKYRLDKESPDAPPIMVHEAKSKDYDSEFCDKVKCVAPVHWIISHQLGHVLQSLTASDPKSQREAFNNRDSISTKRKLESFQRYMSNHKPFSVKPVDPWTFENASVKPIVLTGQAEDEDEDIFSGVGRFDPKTDAELQKPLEEVSSLSGVHFETKESTTDHKTYDYQRSSSLDRLNYFDVKIFTESHQENFSDEENFEPLSGNLEKNLMHTLLQKKTPHKFLIDQDDGYENFQEYGFDDDFVSFQDTKKKVKSTRNLKKKAEREYKQIGEVMEKSSYRNLDTLEAEITKNQISGLL